MDTCINKIYEMMYSPIITPYNLLENVKLKNYSYVNYYKGKEGVIAEMECYIPEEGKRIFYYNFDQKDFLVSIFSEHDGIKEKLFDRKDVLETTKEEYNNKYNKHHKLAI